MHLCLYDDDVCSTYAGHVLHGDSKSSNALHFVSMGRYGAVETRFDISGISYS